MESKSTDNSQAKYVQNPKGDWKGAQYLRNTQMLDKSGNYATSFGGVKSAVSGVICDPIHRDIGHCMPFLMKESLQAATQLIYSDDDQAIELLDLVGQLIAKVWNEAVKDNLAGIGLFSQLYEEVRSVDRGDEIYAAFCTFFVQNYFCYLFTVERMAIGIRPLEEGDSELQGMASALSALSTDTRRLVLSEWMEEGLWPTTVNAGPLIRRLEDYIEVIKEGQELRKAHADKAKEDSK